MLITSALFIANCHFRAVPASALRNAHDKGPPKVLLRQKAPGAE
jgi:hypothetical protein